MIFIIDLVSGDNRAFELYNPTTAEGVTTGTVLYPDALEWDYSGELLIYDALNALEGANGNMLEFWDVGVLQAWDNQSADFGDGTIFKLFANLPEGVSIGNPSFAKTSGNILAFDRYDGNTDDYEVFTVNVETGDVETVYANNKLGFPNYSKDDDQLLFDSFNNGDEVIGIISLGADKLTPIGNAQELIPDGKWGIWFTVGQRAILSSAKEITDFRFNLGETPNIGSIDGNEITIAIPPGTNAQNLIATFAASAKSRVLVNGVEQQSGVSRNDFTVPVPYTVVAEDGSQQVYTVRLGQSGPGDPNDTDGDGVANAQDQCPDTPFGTVVDTTGCPIFSLPPNNFTILAEGESCIGANNGSISVNALETLSYVARLSGNGPERVQDFSSETRLEDLAPGAYTLCLTVVGQAGYERCFEVVVGTPTPLSVTGKISETGDSVSLRMQGGERYFITLNGEFFSTVANEIVLPLSADINTLTVKTGQECLGTHVETLVKEQGLTIFPNPVTNGRVELYLPKIQSATLGAEVLTFSGQVLWADSVILKGGRAVLDLGTVSEGVYLLRLGSATELFTQKIVIQN